MKNLIAIILVFNLISCVSKKRTDVIKQNDLFKVLNENSLTKDEYDLLNDLLHTQFTSDRYQGREKNLQKILIEDSGSHWKSLQGYEFCLINKMSFGYGITNWPINSSKLDSLRKILETKKPYIWKVTDIKNYKVQLINSKIFRKTIQQAEYLGKQEKLILYLSRPYIINENYGFIYFNSGSSSTGFTTIERFYVLMKKENEKWIKVGYYEDGFMH